MATESFLHRWANRKKDVAEEESADESPRDSEGDFALKPTQDVVETSDHEEESAPSMEDVERLKEGDSASLFLAKTVSAEVKKAALRKLFHSEAYNVRDGLNEYDLDYTKGESLSAEIAQSLRQWTKEKLEGVEEMSQATQEETEDEASSTLKTPLASSEQATPEDETKSTHVEKRDKLS